MRNVVLLALFSSLSALGATEVHRHARLESVNCRYTDADTGPLAVGYLKLRLASGFVRVPSIRTRVTRVPVCEQLRDLEGEIVNVNIRQLSPYVSQAIGVFSTRTDQFVLLP
jgi:hypothetical protein